MSRSSHHGFDSLALAFLEEINRRTRDMDAVVQTLQSDVATLKTQVAAVLAKLAGAATLPADDAAAITQANKDIEELNSQIASALPPPA